VFFNKIDPERTSANFRQALPPSPTLSDENLFNAMLCGVFQ